MHFEYLLRRKKKCFQFCSVIAVMLYTYLIVETKSVTVVATAKEVTFTFVNRISKMWARSPPLDNV